MSTLERARLLWHAWGDYAKDTRCDACETYTYCRRRSRRGRWLCLDCFDFSPELQRWLRGR